MFSVVTWLVCAGWVVLEFRYCDTVLTRFCCHQCLLLACRSVSTWQTEHILVPSVETVHSFSWLYCSTSLSVFRLENTTDVWISLFHIQIECWVVGAPNMWIQWNPDSTTFKGPLESVVRSGCRMTGVRVNAALIDCSTQEVGWALV